MFDVELYRSESFVVHLLHRIQEISRSGISLFFLRGLQRLSSVIIEYWLQTHALSSFDLLSLSLSLNLSKLGAIVTVRAGMSRDTGSRTARVGPGQLGIGGDATQRHVSGYIT